MATAGVVDLYRFRCAVAVLVHARHHVLELDDTGVDRVDTAIRHVGNVTADLHGDVAAATSWLMSPDADPVGQRTVHAIERLGTLTHVDQAAAPALAARLAAIDHPEPVQQTLFD